MAKSQSAQNTIGQSPEEAMGIIYQVGAQEVSRMMQNATRSQQCLQTVGFTATALIVQKIAKMAASE